MQDSDTACRLIVVFLLFVCFDLFFLDPSLHWVGGVTFQFCNLTKQMLPSSFACLSEDIRKHVIYNFRNSSFHKVGWSTAYDKHKQHDKLTNLLTESLSEMVLFPSEKCFIS